MPFSKQSLHAARSLLAVSVLLGVLLAPWASHPLQAQPVVAPLKVLLFSGNDPESDAAVLAALLEPGNNVDLGGDTAAFNGTQADLNDYAVVVVLNHANWSASVPPAGLQALRRYIMAGGAVVIGEWFVWKGLLDDLLPVESCGYNTAPATTYTRSLPALGVNQGLPFSFRFDLSRFSGSEGCLRPRAGASLLYRSSNGGGMAGSAGVAAWNAGDGRVVAFSNLLAANELRDEHLRRLLQNVVGWVAQQRDITAPILDRLTLAQSGELRTSRQVQIDTLARDTGGSGLGSLYIVEYMLTPGPRPRFRPVARSGWLSYHAASHAYTWTLTNQPGVHYLQVWVADRAGNISPTPLTDFVSYFEGSAAIKQGQRTIYRIKPRPFDEVTISMAVLLGDPDLYVYNASGEKMSADLFTAATETASFVADGGTYQIEVEGLTSGRYYLETSAELLPPRDAFSTPGRLRPPALGLAAAPLATHAVLPAAPPGRGIDLFVPMMLDD